MGIGMTREEKLAYILNDEELSPTDLAWLGTKVTSHAVSREFARRFAPESDRIPGNARREMKILSDVLNSSLYVGSKVPMSTKLPVDDDQTLDRSFDAQSIGDDNQAP